MEPIFRKDAYARQCDAKVIAHDERGIRLDRTVFYPLGGGQPGDTGRLLIDGREWRVIDTVKGDGPDDALHVLEDGVVPPPLGATVTAEIDWDRRYRMMRMHTLLHLLSALVIDAKITGAQVGPDKSRVDFSLESMSSIDKDALSAKVNALISADHPVGLHWISDAELEANPDLVRSMSVRPPVGFGMVRLVEVDGVDLQPCGGTHVARTGEIGPATILKLENKGKMNRRIVVTLDT